MKILEYADYNSLSLPKGIVLTNDDRMKICNIIDKSIHAYYDFDKNINKEIIVDGIKLNTEYLSKAVNNRTLLKKIVYDASHEIESGVRTKEELFLFIRNNLFNLFNVKGKWFKYVYKLLSSTSKKGDELEDIAFQKFEELSKLKGIDIEIKGPTIDEDKHGIDGIFFYNSRRCTIQVKPLFKMEDYKKDPTKYIVFCDGVLKGLTTDYLIVIKDNDVKIFRSKGIQVNPSFFIIPKENLIR